MSEEDEMRGDSSKTGRSIGEAIGRCPLVLAACLSGACGALGAGEGSVHSVGLEDQIKRVNVETDRSDETVEAMLARLQPVLTSRGERATTAAREQLDVATRACQRQANQLERQLPGLDKEGAAFFEGRRAALSEIDDPAAREVAAAKLEVDLERFLEYQASAVAALDAYEELNLELHAILEVLPQRPERGVLTEDALDLRNQAWSLRMILEDCKRAAKELQVR